MKFFLSFILILFSTNVYAQVFTKPVNAYIASAAGGNNDVVFRIILNKLSRNINQTIIPINMPGASGINAGKYVLQQPADGYNWYLNFDQFTLAPAVFPGMMNTAEFKPVALTSDSSLILVSNSKYKSIEDLKHAVELYEGCAQIGTDVCYLNMKLKARIQLKSKQIMYTLQNQVILDTAAGRLDWTFAAINPVKGYVEEKQLNILATLRKDVLPNVKSFSELGIDGFDNFLSWQGFLVRKETPDHFVEELSKQLEITLSDPEVIDSLQKIGTKPNYMNSINFGNLISRELEEYK